MIKGKDILYFSADDWGCGLMTSQTHIALTLAKENRILYVNSLGLRKPQVSKKDFGKICCKLSKFFQGIKQVEKNIWVFTPIILPFHNLRIIRRMNALMLVLYLRHYLQKLNMKRPIFWSFLPNAVHLIGKFNESKVIYYCVDEYAEFDGVPSEALRRQEKQIIEKSDYVFTTAKFMYQRKKNGNPNTYYMPHGVDVFHFMQAMNPQLELPDELKDIPRPIIGFYGLIESWLDLDMIFKAAYHRPDWSFVFLGDTKVDVNQLKLLKNIYFLGKIPYKQLPQYNKGFDVAIIPFVLNELTRNVNPIKLREYLAAGTPVVSTSLPEVQQYQHIVYVAQGTNDFIEKIDLALKEKGPVALEKRLDFVKNESWPSRMEQISKIIMNGGNRF